jgi:PAS domain S-box-containing protein
MSIYSSIDKTKVRVLIIEDEKLLRDYVADYLEDTGYNVSKAGNGREGLELFRKLKPDLVITDLRMPEINGLEVMAFLKAEAPETPIIVVSGTGSLEDVVQTIKLGAWDYILKPIKDIMVVDMAIDRAVERKALIEENRRHREHLEQEVMRRTQELLKSNEKFKILFNHAGDAIFMHELDGRISEINQKATEYLGYSREEFRMIKMQEIYTAEELLLMPHYQDLLNRKKYLIFESAHRHKQGHSIPVEVNACLVDLDGTPMVFAICRDITERKLAEEERQSLEKQFMQAQKMESLGLLAGGIAHDFKNILGSISGYSQLLERRFEPESKEAHYLTQMQGATQRGIELTTKLTSFTRKSSDEFVKIDLHKVLADAAELLRPNCKKIEIILDCQAGESLMMGDAALLVNAFINLGLNARDAMPENGTLTLRTDMAELNPDGEGGEAHGGAYLRVLVADTGIGMTAEVLAHLFEPLFTTKEPGKGTGLGLSSVYNCIRQHHGVIEVDSAEGRGTTFKILLPLLRSEEAQLAASAPQAGTPQPKILVVDDEKMVRLLVQQNLRDLGYEVLIKEKAIEAIDCCQQGGSGISLVLIDYSLPLMNGEELLRELKKANPALKALYLLSGEVGVPERSGWDEAVLGCITKPFNAEQLCISVAKALAS